MKALHSFYSPEQRFLIEILAALVLKRTVRYFPQEDFDWTFFYQLAGRHNLSVIPAYVLHEEITKMPPKIAGRFTRDHETALFFEARRELAYQAVSTAFETKNIPYLTLKGHLIRQWYPSPELRTMGDLDLLVPADRFFEGVQVLQDLGFELVQKEDNQYVFRKNQIVIELHRTFYEAFRYQASSELFENETSDFYDDASFWRRVLVREGTSRREADRLDFFLMFFIHLARHFLKRGIGARYILDYKIVKDSLPFTLDDPLIAERLRKLSLTEFASQIDQLAEVWFSDASDTPISDRLGRFILTYTVHGEQTMSPQMGLAQAMARHSSPGEAKRRFIGSLFVPSFVKLSGRYPALKRRPVLYPFYVSRWIAARLFHFSNWPLYIKNILWVFRTSSQELDAKTQLYRDLGLRSEEKNREE